MSESSSSADPRLQLSVVSAVVLVLIIASVGISVAVGSGTVNPPPRIAFVARADNPADALAMGPMAGRLGAPLFTTWPDRLDDSAKTGLQNFAPEVVIVAGGDGAIWPQTEQAIKEALPGASVTRVAGTDRNDTAAKAADLIATYSPAFLPVDATATDADLLDGKDSSEFLLTAGGLEPQSVHVGLSEGAVDETVEIAALVIRPGDPCGDASTRHRYFATFSGAAHHVGDDVGYAGVRVVSQGEGIDINSTGSGPGTTAFLLGPPTVGTSLVVPMSVSRLFTDIRPGEQAVRVLLQEFRGNHVDVRHGTLTLLYVGYDCP